MLNVGLGELLAKPFLRVGRRRALKFSAESAKIAEKDQEGEASGELEQTALCAHCVLCAELQSEAMSRALSFPCRLRSREAEQLVWNCQTGTGTTASKPPDRA